MLRCVGPFVGRHFSSYSPKGLTPLARRVDLKTGCIARWTLLLSGNTRSFFIALSICNRMALLSLLRQGNPLAAGARQLELLERTGGVPAFQQTLSNHDL